MNKKLLIALALLTSLVFCLSLAGPASAAPAGGKPGVKAQTGRTGGQFTEEQKEAFQQEWLPAYLKYWDKNKNGQLDEDERALSKKSRVANREANKLVILKKYDKNKNGQIDEEEKEAVRSGFKANREKLTKKFDKNKDGKLDVDEKVKYLEFIDKNPGGGV